MNRLPPLKALQAFRHAGECGSFKEAAEQLHVTQAAISQQIRSLEEHLDVRLFQRKTREVSLTPEGQTLLSHISKAFRHIETGVLELSKDPYPDQLTLSALPSFAARWLVPRLGFFQQHAEDINIRLTPSLGLASFDDKSLDLAIRFGTGDYPGLESRLLLEDYLLPVCHPSLFDPEQPIRPQLTRMPMLIDQAPDVQFISAEVEEALGFSMEKSKSKLYVSDANMLVEALLSAQGLAMMRFSLVYELLQRGQLICPEAVAVKSAYSFFLVAPPAHFQRDKIIRFEHWLREELRVIEAGWLAFSQQHDLQDLYG
ncbi:LysR family transcriptional regulator [Aliamphritea spongicola]|uniref:LysR family transcriptional regulator n=1 Tax=Aliamphritea spongicola TaxID=707589 RepID=UPI00196B5228|nr:LysR family transcriptional regulator [Aliamphritea spongicola]MBN3561727.1 LysR family transcriptional regulator [Aliamphritea spongicola]